jgi:chromate reductase, NAD(P)H dehydrogenase (quinone)
VLRHCNIHQMRLVAVNGSLRRASSNGALLRAISRVVPSHVEVVLYDGLVDLPHFNPDLDTEGVVAPTSVAETRLLLIRGDAVVISSPEYAHGIPGSLKNMLDWLVSTGELAGKPVALLNASPTGGMYAQSALLETLRTMNWRVIEDASLVQPFVTERIIGELEDSVALERLKAAIALLIDAVRA